MPMVFKTPFAPRANRRRGPLPLTITILVLLSIALVSMSGFYADWLWFNSVSFTKVWQTTLFTKAWLFVLFGFVTSLVIISNVLIAYRSRPIFAPLTIEADNLERYRAQIEPVKRMGFLALTLGLFYFAGSAGSQLWEPWLLWKNAAPFGINNPPFNLQFSFFAFSLPFLNLLMPWGI